MRMRWLFLLALTTFAAPANAQPQGHYTSFTPMVGWIQMSDNLRYPAD